MTPSPIRFLWDFNTNRPRVYLSDISNFILIEYKRAKIQSREVNGELWRKNEYYVIVTLTFNPRSPISIGFEPVQLAKTASISVHLFGWNSIHKQSRTHTQRQTDRHTHTDKLQWIYNPCTMSWRCKNKRLRSKYSLRIWSYILVKNRFDDMQIRTFLLNSKVSYHSFLKICKICIYIYVYLYCHFIMLQA